MEDVSRFVQLIKLRKTKLCEKHDEFFKTLYWSTHALSRQREREVKYSQVFDAVFKGKIIYQPPRSKCNDRLVFEYKKYRVVLDSCCSTIITVIRIDKSLVPKKISPYLLCLNQLKLDFNFSFLWFMEIISSLRWV